MTISNPKSSNPKSDAPHSVHRHDDHVHDEHEHDHDDHLNTHAHDHEHDHVHDADSADGHQHGLHHHHAPADFGRAFAIGTVLNLAFVAIEAGYGFYANSIALLADAGHNLSDVAGLVIAWIAAILAKRPPTSQFTYGLGTASILSALINAALLLIAVVGIVWAAIDRIATPQHVDAQVVFWVASIGIVINFATAMLFYSGAKNDLNIRGAFLHMAADAAVSLGVVIAAVVIMVWGYTWLDPLISIAIAAVILWGTWGLLRDSLHLSVDGAPRGIDIGLVRTTLANLPGVSDVHDLHIWPLSTTQTALSAHLVIPTGHPGDAFLVMANEKLTHDFEITHATLQIEHGDGPACALRCDHQ